MIVSKEAAKHQERLLRKMDLAATTLGKAIAHVEGELSRPLQERAALGNLNQEVRAHARGLTRPERVTLISEAFERGDTDTLQAILGAQPFLSGLSAPEHAYYLNRYNSEQSPQLVARLTVMRAAHDKVGRDASKVIVEMQKAVGSDQAKINSINAANEQAVAALRIEPTA